MVSSKSKTGTTTYSMLRQSLLGFPDMFCFFWFWITLPKNHFTEFLWPFDRNTIWPNRRLTEHLLTESLFYRKVIWPFCFSKNGNFTEYSFDRKNHLTEKKLRLTKNSFAWKFIWPKAFTENGHLTERSFDRKFTWPKAFFEKWSFDRKIIWPKGHLNERSFDLYFWNIVVWPKVFFSKYCHLTDCSYSIRKVCMPNFFVTTRRRERFFFLFCH
jgi:hypothetical protein